MTPFINIDRGDGQEDQTKALEDLLKELGAPPDYETTHGSVFAAWCDGSGYEERAFVLLRRDDGEWFEVNASHCSCHGFEGQWEPSRTKPLAIINRHFFVRQLPEDMRSAIMVEVKP